MSTVPSSGARVRAVLLVAGAALLVAGLAALVFLIRAGGDPGDPSTWPITWELRSSDNGVLFQFFQDLTAGRPMDWSFSPQVYVVPELPVSGIAFLLAAGDLYRYYVVVAALNAAGLLLALVALVRVAAPRHTLGAATARALLAASPLLLLPLVGTTWLLSFHLAPSYYVGEYAAILLAPVLVLARTRGVRIAAALFLGLTIASDPLTLIFVGAGALAALVAAVVRSGRRSVLVPGAWVAGTLAGALVARLLMSPLEGISPLGYVDLARFTGRLAVLGPYYAYEARNPPTAVLLIGGACLAVLALVAVAWAAERIVRRRRASDPVLVVVIFLGVIPVGGILGTLAALITHYYYFWPALVLPYVLALLVLPRALVRPGLAVAGTAFLLVALATGGIANLASLDRYAGYRTPETQCLDAAAPGELGYATFSDARRLGLPSATGIRLVPVTADLAPNHWLANRAMSTTEGGSFFYVNGRGDEVALDTGRLVAAFGQPDAVVACGDAQEVWLYRDVGKLARIADFYDAPR